MGKWESSFLKWFLLFLLGALLINIGTFVLIHEEPRRGIITFEMLKSHNFLQPTVLGIPYFKKPPFHEWITSLFSLFGGVSETTLRIPSALSVVLTSAIIYLLTKDSLGRRGALFSSLIYPTFFVVLFGYSTKCEPDTLLSLLVTSSILLWFLLMERGRKFTAWFTGYFFTSLALLTKGLPALQFFLFFVLPYLFIKGKLRELLSKDHIAGLLLGLSPFFLWLFSVNTETAVKTLLSEVLSRAPTKTSWIKAIKNYATYPFRFLLATFPWSIVALYFLFRRNLKLKLEGDLLKASLLAFSLDFLLYWLFPGSRLRYLMPALPLLSIILSQALSEKQLIHKRAKEILKFTSELIVPIGIVAGVILTKNPSLILRETVIFLIFLYGLYFFFIPRFNFSHVVVLTTILMLIFRGFYSSYYYPIAEYKYPPVRETGKKIAADTKNYRLFTKTAYLQLCFYVEKFRNRVLKYSKNPPKDSLFLSTKREGHVLKEYRLGKHTFFLCSYGISRLERKQDGEGPRKQVHERHSRSSPKSGSPRG